jgi:ubiquinone/menaquinone biosynthesis C-methylase UbiE
MASPLLTPLAAAVLHVGSPERVLEIGCGDGEGSLFLAREFPSARIRGVDGSEEAVREAAARVGLDPEGRLAFKRGQPRRLPFPDDHFDLLVAVDIRPAPDESARVLRPGGFLVVAATATPEPLAGISGRLLARRLRRRGFVAIWSDLAGDGSFSVERLGGDGAMPLPL